MKRFYNLWLPVVLWAAIIFFFSANSDPYKFLPQSWRTMIPLREVSDFSIAEWIGQFMHFIEFSILAILLSRAMQFAFPTKSMTFTVLLFSMLFSLSDEIHQLFVPGRSFQLIDLFVDFLGSLAGVYLYRELKADRKRKKI